MRAIAVHVAHEGREVTEETPVVPRGSAAPPAEAPTTDEHHLDPDVEPSPWAVAPVNEGVLSVGPLTAAARPPAGRLGEVKQPTAPARDTSPRPSADTATLVPRALFFT